MPMEKVNWKLTIAYDGTDFHGWQVQGRRSSVPMLPIPTIPTIQQTLADAIATVIGEQVLPQGSGRTDAGVHAAAQVASFSLSTPIPPPNFHRALNRVLPCSIRVLAAEHAPPGFHARHSAVGKIYRYRIFSGAECSPFLARYTARSRWPLDLAAMQEAAQAILGEHDFTSFAARDPDRATRLREFERVPHGVGVEPPSHFGSDAADANRRRIERSDWSCSEVPASELDFFAGVTAGNGPAQVLTYTVEGNGFLHHMVRNLVGTFMEVGRGRIAPESIPAILQARDRTHGGPTAAASGLCLMKVLY